MRFLRANVLQPAMETFLFALVAFCAGYLLGDERRKGWRSYQLMPKLNLSATQPVTVAAKLTKADAEGNSVGEPIEIPGRDLTITVDEPTGDFGTIDADGVFNPGTLGATGTIVVTAEVEGQSYSGSVEVELVAGEATQSVLAVDLEPVPETNGDGSEGGTAEPV